jgi:ABC-type polar amino acid transport system ATPase subunit
MELLYFYSRDFSNSTRYKIHDPDFIFNKNYDIHTTESSIDGVRTITFNVTSKFNYYNLFKSKNKDTGLQQLSCIIGANATGKTSILRSLHSLNEDSIEGFLLYLDENNQFYFEVPNISDYNHNEYKIILKYNQEIISYNLKDFKTSSEISDKWIISNAYDRTFGYINNANLLTPEKYINEDIKNIYVSPYKFPNFNNNLIENIRAKNICDFLELYKKDFANFRLPSEYKIIVKNDLDSQTNLYVEEQTDSKNRRDMIRIINTSSILDNIRNKKHTIKYLKLLFLVETISISFTQINELIKKSHIDEDSASRILLNSIEQWVDDDSLIKHTINSLILFINEHCDDNTEKIGPFERTIISKDRLKVYVESIIYELYSIYDLFNILTEESITTTENHQLTTFAVNKNVRSNNFTKTNNLLKIILNSNIHTRMFFEVNYVEPYSTGEFSLLSLYSKINIAMENNNDSLKLILLDEIDSYIHPQWQKDVIYNLVNFLNEYNQKSHLIITTHSPIVLSDIPKDNVIKLINSGTIVNDSEQCIYNDGKIKSSFGSNIHTLYKDSFFLDSTIGKFAYSRITNCIKFLTDYEIFLQGNISKNDFENKHIPISSINEKRKEVEYIISIIGEPIIKKKLENMYEKVFANNSQYYKNEYYKLLEEKKTLQKMLDSNSINSVMKILDRKILELQAKAGDYND